MASVGTRPRPLPARLEQISTRIVFFITGFGTAAWAPLVPFVKARAGLDEGVLGLLLLCLGMGSIVAMPLAGLLTARLGCRSVITVSVGLLCLTLPLLAMLSSLPLLVAALFAFGAGVGSLDVSVNIQAIIVERASGRPMMSGFHGLFSLGGIVGAASVALLLGAGASPLAAAACVSGGNAVALAVAAPHLLRYGIRSQGPVFAVPHGSVLLVGALCFIVYMTEGAVLDWSAVFLNSARGVEKSRAGLGYAAFALTMTIGRLAGDRIVARLGGARLILWGGVCAGAGFTFATLAPSWQMALIGFALVGAGCSNIVPVLFTAAGRQTVMPENVAVSAITTLGYGGALIGPAAIGFVAHAANLSAAFLIVAALLLGVAACGRLVRA